MTAPMRIDRIDRELEIPQKSLYVATSAALNLSTSFQDVITYTVNGVAGSGAWLWLGNAPYVTINIAWTKSSGTLFSLLPIFGVGEDPTVDPTEGAPPPYIPQDTDGTNVAYPNIVTFSTTDWTTTTSPLSSATVYRLGCVLKTNGHRLVKFQTKSDNASGSCILRVTGGTYE